MAGCGSPAIGQHSYVVSVNKSWTVYGCREGYRYLAGDLQRHCVNNTWAGDTPTCTVDSVLPKAYLVMLIIGATLSVFVACIPYDFYRFRRRKKAARKHQERLSLMTRIAPGHAKMMTETLPVGVTLPAGQRRFGFRSLIKAFRFVAEKMKTTNDEDSAEAGTSTGLTDPATTSTTTGIDITANNASTTTITNAITGNNGGLVTGTGAGNVSPHAPASPNPKENLAARARMSAVLQLWTGRGTRAKSLDISDDHVAPRPTLIKHKRNSLVTGSNSAIQAAATTAATAAAAATASCGSYDEPPDLDQQQNDHQNHYRRQSASFSSDDDSTCGSRHHKSQQHLSPCVSVDSNNPLLAVEPLSPPISSFRLPHIGSARYVQLAASIPEDTDETEDGACVGGKFKVTDRKKVSSSNSLPSSWGEVRVSPHSPDTTATTTTTTVNTATKVVPLTEENVAALTDGKVDSAVSPRSKDSDTTDSIQGRVDNSSGRNSLENKSISVCTDTLLAPPRPRPLQRQLSQDMERQGDYRLSRTSSLATDDSDTPLQGPTTADIH